MNQIGTYIYRIRTNLLIGVRVSIDRNSGETHSVVDSVSPYPKHLLFISVNHLRGTTLWPTNRWCISILWSFEQNETQSWFSSNNFVVKSHHNGLTLEHRQIHRHVDVQMYLSLFQCTIVVVSEYNMCRKSKETSPMTSSPELLLKHETCSSARRNNTHYWFVVVTDILVVVIVTLSPYDCVTQIS